MSKIREQFNLGNIIALAGLLLTMGFFTWLFNAVDNIIDKKVQSVLIDPDTKEPTKFTNQHIINPIISESKRIINEVFMDSAKVKMLVQSADMNVDKLKRAYNSGDKLFRGLDSINVGIDDIINSYAEKKNDEYTYYGLYRVHASTSVLSDYFDLNGNSWRELFFSIPDKYIGEYCEPFWWYVSHEGEIIPRREISIMVQCPN